ncbi:MAG: Ig-like domain-containing protein [Clostridia bacterium]|nr:Ig-like domain-containing protein [Clostridia bacterium]
MKRNLQNIDFSFNNDLSVYQNYYVTSLNEIEFQILPTPLDATLDNLNYYVDNEDVASVENGKIIFKKEGIIKLSVFSNSVLSSISIRHSKTPISFDLLVNNNPIANEISVNVNDILTFKAINIIPNDLSSEKLNIELLQNFPNRFGDLVCSVNNSTIMALHGGSAKYQISFNGKIYKNNIQVTVIQRADEIVCLESIKTSNPSYLIYASISPSDATNPLLEFEILENSNIATISNIGEVNFLSEGTIFVKISNEFSNIYKTIEITYSKALKTIEIDDCPDYIFIGKTMQLSAQISPDEAQNEEVVWEVNNNLANISPDGLLTPFKNEGKIVVSAHLKNYPDVKAEKTIEIFAIITDIYLNEDSRSDNVGIEGKKVFGTHNFEYGTNNKFTNQFILGYQITHNCADIPNLDFVSSNTNIATISSTGVVTVLSPGQVTISVYPKKQISNDKNRFVFDSYTFNFVTGVNVYSEREFIDWNNYSLNDIIFKQNPYLCGVVLQNNIKIVNIGNYQIQIRQNSNIYGNGNLLDLNQNDKMDRGLLLKSNTTMRNITVRGYTFKENESIINIQYYNTLITTAKDSTNIKLEFCNLQNDKLLLSVMNSSVELSGCILENSAGSSIYLSSAENTKTPNYLTINSCVFDNCLNGCVSSVLPSDQAVNHFITINGFMDMYNWQPLSLISKLKYKAISVDAIRDYINSSIKTYSYMLKEVDGEKYWHVGLLFVDCSVSFEGVKFNVKNTSSIEFNNTNNPYSLQKISESFVIGKVNIYNYSLSGSTNYFIQPKTSYKDNTLGAYEKIRRNFKN